MSWMDTCPEKVIQRLTCSGVLRIGTQNAAIEAAIICYQHDLQSLFLVAFNTEGIIQHIRLPIACSLQVSSRNVRNDQLIVRRKDVQKIEGAVSQDTSSVRGKIDRRDSAGGRILIAAGL